MPGCSLTTNIKALEELCGDTTLKSVVIMTYHRDTDRPEAEQMMNSDLSPGGCFYPAIEQGAQVYHCTGASEFDLGALRIILRGRPVIPKVQQELVNEGSGPEQIAPATELCNEILELAERRDNDFKKLEESMQEVMDKKIEKLRRELEEDNIKAREEADGLKKRIAEMQLEERIRKETCQKLEEQRRRAREEADGLRKYIAEMQSKLEEDRHTSGKAFELSAHSFPPRLKAFLVGPCTHLVALQRVYPLTDLHSNSPIVSTTHFTARTMSDVSKTSRRVTPSGSLTIWTRHVTFSPFLTVRSSWSVGSRQSRSFGSRFPKVFA